MLKENIYNIICDNISSFTQLKTIESRKNGYQIKIF